MIKTLIGLLSLIIFIVVPYWVFKFTMGFVIYLFGDSPQAWPFVCESLQFKEVVGCWFFGVWICVGLTCIIGLCHAIGDEFFK